MCVKVKEVFQTGEKTVKPARVHLEVLLQLSDVHSQHYLQRSHMVHLRLHQFCNNIQILWQSNTMVFLIQSINSCATFGVSPKHSGKNSD